MSTQRPSTEGTRGRVSRWPRGAGIGRFSGVLIIGFSLGAACAHAPERSGGVASRVSVERFAETVVVALARQDDAALRACFPDADDLLTLAKRVRPPSPKLPAESHRKKQSARYQAKTAATLAWVREWLKLQGLAVADLRYVGAKARATRRYRGLVLTDIAVTMANKGRLFKLLLGKTTPVDGRLKIVDKVIWLGQVGGPHPIVRVSEGLTARACACKDRACITKLEVEAKRKLAAIFRRLAKFPSPKDMKALSLSRARFRACAQRLGP